MAGQHGPTSGGERERLLNRDLLRRHDRVPVDRRRRSRRWRAGGLALTCLRESDGPSVNTATHRPPPTRIRLRRPTTPPLAPSPTRRDGNTSPATTEPRHT